MENSKTPEAVKLIKRQQQREKLFDEHMRDADVEQLLRIRPFKAMDASLFPSQNSLHKILKTDTRIRRFDAGEVIVRQGDYGDSAFLILAGAVHVSLDIEESILGRTKPKPKGVISALAQLWTDHSVPERRDVSTYNLKQDLAYQATGNKSDSVIFLQDMSSIIANHQTDTLRRGQLFGHISCMARSPRSATVMAAERTEILEIKWQALRDIMRYSKEFRSQLEEEYRRESLVVQLRTIDMFKKLADEQIKSLADSAIFETYGLTDWNNALRKARDEDDEHVQMPEELIVAQGDYADDLILIRGGFARVAVSEGEGRRTVDYKKRGDIFGDAELSLAASGEERPQYRHSLLALGYTDVIRIPGRFVQPYLKKVKQKSVDLIASESSHRDDLLSLYVDNLFINGTRSMVINLDRCTECDDCVVACANAHDGNPRFVRHGPKAGKFMIANACMHCSDPVCMVGCPTGAIHRDVNSGVVVINDQACIGCSTCANSCPYDNIRMTNITGIDGELILDESHAPISKATKCDYCVDQRVAPACEYACPNNALKRLDAHNIDVVKEWLE